jgi:hypothetical protein
MSEKMIKMVESNIQNEPNNRNPITFKNKMFRLQTAAFVVPKCNVSNAHLFAALLAQHCSGSQLS